MPSQSLRQKIELAAKSVLESAALGLNLYMGHEAAELKRPSIEIIATQGQEIAKETGIYRCDLELTVAVHSEDKAHDLNDVESRITAEFGQAGITETLAGAVDQFYVYDINDSSSEPEPDGSLKAVVISYEIVAVNSNLT